MFQIGVYRFNFSVLPSLLALIMLSALCGLGFWQLQRAQLKDALIAASAERLSAGSQPFDSSQASQAQARFTVTRLSGQYDSDTQLLLDNRVHNGRVGYHVLTPFKVDGIDSWVLVNRGWVALGENRLSLPRVSVSNAHRDLTGLIDHPNPAKVVLGDSGYAEGGWPRVIQRIEFDNVARITDKKIVPVVVLLDAAQADGYERQWQVYYGISPDRHRAYAFQWFSLAAALLVIVIVVSARRQRGELEEYDHEP